MSLIKSIEHGREHRKPYYRKAQSVSKSCRCHGGCEYCLGNRMHHDRKMDEALNQSRLDAGI